MNLLFNNVFYIYKKLYPFLFLFSFENTLFRSINVVPIRSYLLNPSSNRCGKPGIVKTYEISLWPENEQRSSIFVSSSCHRDRIDVQEEIDRVRQDPLT